MGTHGGKNWGYPGNAKRKMKNSIEPAGCKRANGRWKEEASIENGWMAGGTGRLGFLL